MAQSSLREVQQADRKRRLRMLINFRAHNENRGYRFGPMSAFLAWRDWVLDGEVWLAGLAMANRFREIREQDLEDNDG